MPQWHATGVSIDSRTLNPGDLFVALKGPLTDGHQHVSHAYAQGAAAAIVEQPISHIDPSFPQMKVPDSFKAFCDLAHAARIRAKKVQIVGITGSFGKTSSREALRHILSRQGLTHATERNFNNLWGVPLSVARMSADCQFAVLEMGTNHPGEIEPLSKIIRPHIAFITTIGNAHIGNFGSLDHIADGKAEIFAGVEAGGIAVLNCDDPQYIRLKSAAEKHHLRIITFGKSSTANSRLKSCNFENNMLTIKGDIVGQEVQFTMNVSGEHWALNMIGVLTCIQALGQDVKQAAQALTTFSAIEGRGAMHRISYGQHEILVIDDSYNAGPLAMQAALESLGKLAPQRGGRRIAVLGDMADLGEFMKSEHMALDSFIFKNDIQQVFLYGPFMKKLYELLPAKIRGGHFETVESLTVSLLNQVQNGDCILVKGARGQRAYDGIMYQVVVALQSLGNQPLLTQKN